MLSWLKKYWVFLAVVGFAVILTFFGYGCEPKVVSLNGGPKMVNRAELQLELEQIISTAQLRMLDLDKQEQLRGIILENALILVNGQPMNPVGIITAVAALYGFTQGGRNISKVVKTKRKNKGTENGTT